MSEESNESPRLKCIYGNKVKLKNLNSGEITEYTLVTYEEEKLSENHISNYTDIGRGIWAKHEGDEMDIEVADLGVSRYKILEIDNAD